MSITLGRITFNWREIKKLIGGALGFLGVVLVQYADVIPADWRPVATGVVVFLGLVGIYKPTGPTGLPVLERRGSHAQPE